jgi:hypothetical protein
MPWMNFDLQDGKPPIGFNLKPDDCERFMEFLAECQTLKESAGSSDQRPYDEAVEALRKGVCALPRYSFLLNSGGGVSRVLTRCTTPHNRRSSSRVDIIYRLSLPESAMAGEGAKPATRTKHTTAAATLPDSLEATRRHRAASSSLAERIT